MADSIPVLETERTIMRGWRPEDLDAYEQWSTDPEVMRYLGGPADRAQAWRTLALFIGHWELRGYGQWALERKSDARVIGRVGLWSPEGWPGIEIGWMLEREVWGQGYATECARAARRWAWASLPHLGRLVSVIAPDNVLSRRVAERLGMEVVGTWMWGDVEALLYQTQRPTQRSWDA